LGESTAAAARGLLSPAGSKCAIAPPRTMQYLAAWLHVPAAARWTRSRRPASNGDPALCFRGLLRFEVMNWQTPLAPRAPHPPHQPAPPADQLRGLPEPAASTCDDQWHDRWRPVGRNCRPGSDEPPFRLNVQSNRKGTTVCTRRRDQHCPRRLPRENLAKSLRAGAPREYSPNASGMRRNGTRRPPAQFPGRRRSRLTSSWQQRITEQRSGLSAQPLDPRHQDL